MMALGGATSPPTTTRQSIVTSGGASIVSSILGTTSDIEQKLSLISAHKSVLGYMLLSRGHPVSMIRHSGVVFEGEQGRRYASAIGKIVESVQAGLEEAHGGEHDGDDVRFMRIRTKRHELMISPDERYLLAVLHDPAT